MKFIIYNLKFKMKLAQNFKFLNFETILLLVSIQIKNFKPVLSKVERLKITQLVFGRFFGNRNLSFFRSQDNYSGKEQGCYQKQHAGNIYSGKEILGIHNFKDLLRMFFDVKGKNNQPGKNYQLSNQSKQDVSAICFHNHFLTNIQAIIHITTLRIKFNINTNILYTSKGRNKETQKTPNVIWDIATKSWAKKFVSFKLNSFFMAEYYIKVLSMSMLQLGVNLGKISQISQIGQMRICPIQPQVETNYTGIW